MFYLYSTPEVHSNDFFVLTDLDENYENADLKIQAKVTNYYERNVGNITFEAMLYDEANSEVLDKKITFPAAVDGKAVDVIKVNQFIENPLKWNAEHPNLYTLFLSLLDKVKD